MQAWTTQTRAGGYVYPHLRNSFVNRMWQTLVAMGSFFLWAVEQPYQ